MQAAGAGGGAGGPEDGREGQGGHHSHGRVLEPWPVPGTATDASSVTGGPDTRVHILYPSQPDSREWTGAERGLRCPGQRSESRVGTGCRERGESREVGRTEDIIGFLGAAGGHGPIMRAWRGFEP